MRQPKENWQPVGLVAGQLLKSLEDKQREKFKRDCADDAVATPQKETAKELA